MELDTEGGRGRSEGDKAAGEIVKVEEEREVREWDKRGGDSLGDGGGVIVLYCGLYSSQSNMECVLSSPQQRHLRCCLHCLATCPVSAQLEQKRYGFPRCSQWERV